MLSGLCLKVPQTTSESEPGSTSSSSSTSSSTVSHPSLTDSVPLVLAHSEKTLPQQVQQNECENSGLLAHLRRLVLGSSTFQFRRLQDADVEEDAHTVVTYISFGASTPQQPHQTKLNSTGGVVDDSQVMPRCLVHRTRHEKSPKKRHVSWKDLETDGSVEKPKPLSRHSLYLPSSEATTAEGNRIGRRHSYTGEDEADKPVAFTSSTLPPPPTPPPPLPPPPPVHHQRQHQHHLSTSQTVDFDERKARYKLQLRHFKRRRRYSDWFFTLYEFDKPENPEESLALDSHVFETILSRLHGIYALSLNSVFDPNCNQKPARLCFERVAEPPSPLRRHQPRPHRRRRCGSRLVDNSSSSCVSCISFGMFDSTSPYNPGQLFCPEREPGHEGGNRSFYCQGCGRNMTGGSSLVSVAGSAASLQRSELCYSMTRSVEFYRFTRIIHWQKPNQTQITESRRRHRASPSLHHSTPQRARERVCRAPKRSRRRSNLHRRPREAVSVPPTQPASMQSQQSRYSAREKRRQVRKVMHKRMSQQRVADWLVATHGGQAGACNAPLIVF